MIKNIRQKIKIMLSLLYKIKYFSYIPVIGTGVSTTNHKLVTMSFYIVFWLYSF